MVGSASDRSASPQQIALAMRHLVQAGRDMHLAMARRLGVGETDLAAMDVMVSSPAPLGPVELGHRLGISSASATALVDRLESVGHVRRESHPSDRRRITLHASETARAEVRDVLSPLLHAIDDLTGRLSPADRRIVLAFLDEVTAAMRDFADGSMSTAPHGTAADTPPGGRR